MQIINQIVDRIHVGTGKLDVIRFVVGHMKNGYKTFKALSKDSRRDLIRKAWERHGYNQELYRYVMGGH